MKTGRGRDGARDGFLDYGAHPALIDIAHGEWMNARAAHVEPLDVSDVAQVIDFVTEPSELLIKPRDAQCGGPHIDTPASRAQIHGRADDSNVGMPHAVAT